VACGSAIRLSGEGSLSAARDQLWAEATYRYRAGESWWPAPDDWPLLLEEQEQREIGDAWESRIAKWLEQPEDEYAQIPRDRASMAQLLGGALGLDTSKWTRAEQTRVGNIMTRLGWAKRREATGYYYARPPPTSDRSEVR
jgi:putative DNA primase/helicase